MLDSNNTLPKIRLEQVEHVSELVVKTSSDGDGRLILGDGSEDWASGANCLGINPQAFLEPTGFMEKGVFYAKLVCRGCQVKSNCLEYALEVEKPGIWGRTTQKERREITRQRALAEVAVELT